MTGIICGNCPPGYRCPTLALTAPIPCLAGTYSTLPNSITCTSCPAGSYCLLASTAPIACGAGLICPLGTSEAPFHPTYSCPAGKYCIAGTATGTDCPLGKYWDTVGASTLIDCLTVPAGYYADSVGTASYFPNQCPKGYFCPAGTTNRYANPCPLGTYRDLLQGTQLSDCALCTPGYHCPKNAEAKIICPKGYYCNALQAPYLDP